LERLTEPRRAASELDKIDTNDSNEQAVLLLAEIRDLLGILDDSSHE
jgi:hypothetical protein